MHSQWARIHYVGPGVRHWVLEVRTHSAQGSSVTTCSFRALPPLGPFTNVDSVARKPGEHNSIHGRFASSYPRAHPLSRDAHPGYRIAARKIPCPFVDARTFLVHLDLFLFILLERRQDTMTTTTTTRSSFSRTRAVRTAGKGATTTTTTTG